MAEEAFAATMAARNLDAFTSFISADAVFLNGGSPLRGRQAVREYWSKFFANPVAPFSWAPELAEIAAGGTLGYTEGPVLSSTGQPTGRFYTTWQWQPSGRWLVVFDNGYSVCK
jgi:ketosteroid isomerase-like protein